MIISLNIKLNKMSTINVSEKIQKSISLKELEILINSEEFEDLLLWYQMIKWETWETESLDKFRKELWI